MKTIERENASKNVSLWAYDSHWSAQKGVREIQTPYWSFEIFLLFAQKYCPSSAPKLFQS